MFKDLFEALADIVREWSHSTQVVVMCVLVAFTFYAFARSMIGLKGDVKKINNWGTILIFGICFALLMLYIKCLGY